VTNSAPRTWQPDARPDTAGLVIAVDGPAGSGKSSAARGAALALGLRYLDTGAMYRALTWYLLSRGIDPADPAAVLGAFREAVIDIGTDPAGPRVSVGGQDVAAPIRTRQVSNAVSAVAALPAVREHLIAAQRQIISDAAGAGAGIVAEGRDIGRVVAPDAKVKVFLTASEAARAQRRSADLAADPEVTRQEQARRDQRDAPQMARAADAIELDTTALTLDEVISEIVGLAQARRAAHRG
jgi:cytidylate kinase